MICIDGRRQVQRGCHNVSQIRTENKKQKKRPILGNTSQTETSHSSSLRHKTEMWPFTLSRFVTSLLGQTASHPMTFSHGWLSISTLVCMYYGHGEKPTRNHTQANCTEVTTMTTRNFGLIRWLQWHNIANTPNLRKTTPIGLHNWEKHTQRVWCLKKDPTAVSKEKDAEAAAHSQSKQC